MKASAWLSAADHARFYLVLWAFGFFSLLWSLPAGVAYHLLPQRRATPIGQWGISRGFLFYVWLMRVAGLARFDLTALDSLRDAGPLVIAANHLSLIDVVLIVSRLPRVACITKASLWDNPLLGGGIRLAGYIRNDAPLTLIKSAARTLGQGSQLLVFPEGTRSDGRTLGPFKPGFAAMARQAGVPVQTVFLDSNSGYLGPGWRPHRKPEFPLFYRARLGRRFTLAGRPASEAAAMEAYFRDVLGGRSPP